jgi:hypothetical protein
MSESEFDRRSFLIAGGALAAVAAKQALGG